MTDFLVDTPGGNCGNQNAGAGASNMSLGEPGTDPHLSVLACAFDMEGGGSQKELEAQVLELHEQNCQVVGWN